MMQTEINNALQCILPSCWPSNRWLRLLFFVHFVIFIAGCGQWGQEIKHQNPQEQNLYVLDRYGGVEYIPLGADLSHTVRSLVDELGIEQFPRPDFEHTSVSISHPDGFFVDADFRGLVTLGFDDQQLSDRYLQNIPRDELEKIFLLVGEGKLAELEELDWKDDFSELQANNYPFYLYSSHPDWSDLHRAACLGDITWMKKLLEDGADLNARTDYQETPLHFAALAGHLNICELLIKSGADVKARDKQGGAILSYVNDQEFNESEAEIRALLRKHGAPEDDKNRLEIITE